MGFREYINEAMTSSNAKDKCKINLLKALAKCFGWEVCFLCIILMIQECGIK